MQEIHSQEIKALTSQQKEELQIAIQISGKNIAEIMADFVATSIYDQEMPTGEDAGGKFLAKTRGGVVRKWFGQGIGKGISKQVLGK